MANKGKYTPKAQLIPHVTNKCELLLIRGIENRGFFDLFIALNY